MRLPISAAPGAHAGQAIATACPTGDGWLFEPKWDGFRAICFRDGDEVLLQSRDLKPLDRYFPELAAPLRERLPERCVLDGEIVIAGPDGLDFEALLLRIHPAASRVAMLAEQSPASFVAWDLLALDDRDLTVDAPGRAPGAAGAGARRVVVAGPPDPRHPGPGTGAGLVRAVRGRRTRRGHRQATRCAVPAGQARDVQGQAPADRGLRRCRVPMAQAGRGHRGLAAAGPVRRRGRAAPRGRDVQLHDGAATASWPTSSRPCASDALAGHPWAGWAEWADEMAASGKRVPGATSRWNAGRDLSWEPLRPERVVRGRLRPSAGRPIPPRHDVPALAAGPAAGRLSLRPARDHEPVRARPDLRRLSRCGDRTMGSGPMAGCVPAWGGYTAHVRAQSSPRRDPDERPTAPGRSVAA